MKTTTVTNFLLLAIAAFLGILTLRPTFLSEAVAASSWKSYVPITALGGEAAFLDNATGDILVYDWQKNSIVKVGNIATAKSTAK